ncbi:type IV secretory system conjugative DNA transfer family protein [Pseudonocardia nematodicida]|uniref:Type IV secretory system conjugative DNA transfer family protein n=1 Tax=Pseudonocardia nematodicida TaxID=1206997 RepID=A0ABV1KHF4_9PSEU
MAQLSIRLGGIVALDEWNSLRYLGYGEPRVTLGRLRETRFAAQALRPVLVLGPQRSRKTTGVVIPTLLDWPGPAIVTSVRTDVIDASAKHRGRFGDITVFEPSGGLIHDRRTTGWDPLGDCRTWDDALRTARWLTEASFAGDGIVSGDFWASKAVSLLAPLLYSAALGNRDMRSVISWIRTQNTEDVYSILEGLDAPQAVDSLRSVAESEYRVRDSIYAVLNQITAVYDYSNVMKKTVTGDFDIERFFNGRNNTLYMCAPPDEQEEFAPLFTSLVRRVLREAYRRDAQGLTNTRSPLLVLLDEAGNIAPLANLDTLATTAAGTGIQLVSVFHDISQMSTIYGETKARTIANNHSALLLLPGNRDTLTSEMLTSLIGTEAAQGWRDPVTGRPGPTTGSPFRRLTPGTALCIYEHLSPLILTLRSSSHDNDLRRLSAASRTVTSNESA